MSINNLKLKIEEATKKAFIEIHRLTKTMYFK